MRIRRRTFLFFVSIGLAIASIPLFRRFTVSKVDQLIEPLMIASILSEDDIYQLGISFRNRFPEEDNLEKLKARLSKDRKQEQSPKEYLTNMINQDFISGDTIIIDGWILSITEARQCALYSKIKSSPL